MNFLLISIFFAMVLSFEIASAQPRDRWGNRLKSGDGHRLENHRSHRKGDDTRIGSSSGDSRGKAGYDKFPKRTGAETGVGAGAGAGYEGNVGGGVGVGDAQANWHVGGGAKADMGGNGMGSYGRK